MAIPFAMRYEEFAECLAWWNHRVENDVAWRVPVSDLLKRDEKGNLLSVNGHFEQHGGLVRVPGPEELSGSLHQVVDPGGPILSRLFHRHAPFAL